MDRFWSKVDKNGPTSVFDGGPCWVWTSTIQKDGYGTFRLGGRSGRTLKAHRLAYEMLVNEIPEGLQVDHLCHNADSSCPGGKECQHRRCVNPAHLEAVPSRINLLRGKTIPARNAEKTHCLYGHPFDEANTYIRPKGKRACRSCQRRQDRLRVRDRSKKLEA